MRRGRQGAVKLATRRRRVPLPGGGAVSAVVALPAGVGRAPAVLLAHGAGSDMTHPFLAAVHGGLARAGFAAVKFNFPYSEARRRAPDPRPVLERCFRAVLDAIAHDRRLAPHWVAIGGKSMGGRIASQAAAQGLACDGLVFLGYPLHPPGRPDRLRDAHLPQISAPLLFLQGTRDAFARWDLIERLVARLGERASLVRFDEADHAFAVPKRMGLGREDVDTRLVAETVRWLEARGL